MNGKNLLIVHMESLSNNFYQSNQALFPNIKVKEKESVFYNNYFSTATSTLMVWEDFLYGNTLQYEQCNSVKDEPPFYRKSYSMLDRLKAKGYNTHAISFPRMDTIEYINKKHIFGFENHMDATKDYNDFLKYIENVTVTSHPFALFVGNIISHVSYTKKMNSKNEGAIRTWQEGYRFIDQTVGDIFNILEKKSLLENTVVVLYGDHGDDFWEHSLHDGYAHGIEPYTSIVNTPLMIYDATLKSRLIEDIVTTKDIYDIIFNMLDIKERNSKVIYDNFRSKRKFAFSRNLYTNQKCNVFSFNKSYAIIDKEYTLLVSKKGVEMYAYRQDICNHNNLLDFFILNFQGELVYNKMLTHLPSCHYRDYMNEVRIDEIKKEYYKLKKTLQKRLKKQYYLVGNKSVKKEMNFCKINYIHNYKILMMGIPYIVSIVNKKTKHFYRSKRND